LTISDRNGKYIGSYDDGGMAEWSKAAVLKTVEGNTSVGSNPTPSAIRLLRNFI
jgi:hypothetical protein